MRRFVLGLRTGFRRIVLFRRRFGSVFPRRFGSVFRRRFGPGFRLPAREIFRFRCLRFRVRLLRDGPRFTRFRPLRTVLRERDLRIALRFGPTLFIATQNLQ